MTATFTGIKIADGTIRLVRWLNNNDEPKPYELDSSLLTQVFDEVAGR